ncbi:hypothetical protein EUA66_04625, partial [TM7 phylum sp. oral taxon 349]
MDRAIDVDIDSVSERVCHDAVVGIWVACADATTIAAKATDQIVYKINVTNKGLKATEYTIKEDLADVLQYASLENTGGGMLIDDNSSDGIATKTLLTWPKVTLKPGETQTRIFSVKLAST